MDIAKQELGLTKAAKRCLLRLKGVETLQGLVDMYSEQELLEDQCFKKHSVTFASITECLRVYGMQLYPTFYERKKGLRELPTVSDPENILLTNLELPEILIEKMRYWEKLKTMGDLATALKEYGLKKIDRPESFGLGEFTRHGIKVRVEESPELAAALHDRHTHEKIFFYGYPHYKVREHTRMEEVERTEQGWMGFGGGKRIKVKEPAGFIDVYYKHVVIDNVDRKLLIRTLALYGLYPKHARMRPTLY